MQGRRPPSGSFGRSERGVGAGIAGSGCEAVPEEVEDPGFDVFEVGDVEDVALELLVGESSSHVVVRVVGYHA